MPQVLKTCQLNTLICPVGEKHLKREHKKKKNMFAINKIQLALGSLELTNVLQKDSVSTSQRTRVVSIIKTKSSCCSVALHMKNPTKHIYQMSRQ